MQYERKLADTLYGELWLVSDEEGNRLAVKISSEELLRTRRTVRGNRACDDPRTEARALRRLGRHPNVVTYVGEIVSKSRHMLFTDYVDGDELFYVVAERYPQGVPERLARRLFTDVLNGLRHMHARGFAHLDVSLENVMVDNKTGACKLIDMGTARELHRPLKAGLDRLPGKDTYVAPELARNDGGADLALADVWSLGIVLNILLTGRPLYEQPFDTDPRYVALREGRLRTLHATTGVKVGESAFALLYSMLQTERTRRLTLEQVYHSAWVQAADLHTAVG